ncbi:MAG: hypothetical protein OHK0046_45400 [Anaerolineae bacterium]
MVENTQSRTDEDNQNEVAYTVTVPTTPQAWLHLLDGVVHFAENTQRLSVSVARAIHDRLVNRGEPTREVADALHGKWLGHPLHPVLTDITIGSFALGMVFDVLGWLPGGHNMRLTADKLTTVGTLAAIPTAITGMAEYSAIKQDAARYGAAHGLLNSAVLLCYVRSVAARLTGHRAKAFFYSLVGLTLLGVSGWIGGELVYQHRVGVNHVPAGEIPDWTPAMALADLPEGEPMRVEANGVPVLLFRRGDEVSAINAVCSHAGGPLEEGRVVDGDCVECPWHQSVFNMRTGKVVHTPAVYNQPRYEVRLVDDQIEVRGTAAE